MTDHARAALEGYGPVFEARSRWLETGSAADKAAFDAARDAYSKRFDCSCPTKGPRVCACTYNPASHSDAHETVNRFDSRSQETTMPKSYAQHLSDCGGDTREASARFHAETMQSRRPNTASTVRSDAAEAEGAMRLRNLTAWCTTDEQRKAVQHRLAQQADQEARRKQHLSSVRTDAADGKCADCGGPLSPEDDQRCIKCVTSAAERAQKQRSTRAWRKPLAYSSSRMDSFKGYHPSDDDEVA